MAKGCIAGEVNSSSIPTPAFDSNLLPVAVSDDGHGSGQTFLHVDRFMYT